MDSAAALTDVDEKIARACKIAKRDRAEVQLIAVSKTHPVEKIEPVLEAGHRVFGENRVQEAADKWPALRERYPKISVELTVDMSASLEQELFAHRIDLALQNSPFTRVATGTTEIGRYPLIWVASPLLGVHGHGPLQANDLAGHPILTHARGTRQHSEVAEHLRELQVTARLVPSSNLAAGMQMTIDGMGIAALPAAMVARELANGELVRLDYGWVPAPLHFVARYDARTCASYVETAAEIAAEVAGSRSEAFEQAG